MRVENIVSQSIGAVVIGRNEGVRLERCLKSLKGKINTIIYVDSASTDNSVEIAKKLDVHTLSLDMSIKFTAARARNEGFSYLIKLNDNIKYVQFVDGDCEIVPDWLDSAIEFLEKNNDVAVTCGRRRERYPEKTIYNKLCDLEWETPIGLTKSCGGDALYSVEAFKSVNGFRDDLIAGEEPELCVRLRKDSWQVWRLNKEMTLHDADIKRFEQWWNRSVRCGHAYAEGAYLHGKDKEKHKVKETVRVFLWGLIIPINILILTYINSWFILLFFIYPLQIFRLAIKGKYDFKTNWLHAFFITLGKFPETYGQLKFWMNRFFRKTSELIEYK